MPALEIDSPKALHQLLQDSPGPLKDIVFQGLDLREYSPRLRELSLSGCVFLGCQVDAPLAGHLALQGCLFMPPIHNKPYQPFRTQLYQVEELYQHFDPDSPDLEAAYQATLDYHVYVSFKDPDGKLRPVLVDETLARRIHDNSISDALDEFLVNFPHRSLVAIMGGHAVSRADKLYRDIAELARLLRRQGFLLGSGGGPGLMEATNLGCHLAPYPDSALEEALALLAEVPTFRSGTGRWVASGFRVRERFPERPGGESLGIPTWFYGHEPPNVFASHIAKYFENSLREEGLLALALGGILFAPGGAGTIQEIFQDACQNMYTTYTIKSPMIFYPSAYWTQDYPVFPVMEKLAAKGQFRHLLHLCEDLSQVPQLFLRLREI